AVALRVELEAIALEPHLSGRTPGGRAPAQVPAVRVAAQRFCGHRRHAERPFDGGLQGSESPDVGEADRTHVCGAEIRIERGDEWIRVEELLEEARPEERFQMDHLVRREQILLFERETRI